MMCCSMPSRRRNSSRSKRLRPSRLFSRATARHRSPVPYFPSKAAGLRSDEAPERNTMSTTSTTTSVSKRRARASRRSATKPAVDPHDALPGQVVLVLQGGGALGAYQVGIYEAMHEAGIEPDWVIGTSIGAINAALIAGNAPEHRLERLHAFWASVEQRAGAGLPEFFPGLANTLANM